MGCRQLTYKKNHFLEVIHRKKATEKFILGLSDGYVEPDGDSFRYVYQYKDHLHNVRLTYSDIDNDNSIDPQSEIISEKNYYPFGLLQRGYNNIMSAYVNSAASKFQHSNKELNEELGLDWYDFGARNYDASLGRWFGVDPLAEKYYYDSPYAYTTNNPILFIDPNGMNWKRSVGEDGTVTYTAQKGDSAWSLYQDFGKQDGFTAAQANKLVESQIAKNYVRESDGMVMSNVEIGNTVTIAGSNSNDNSSSDNSSSDDSSNNDSTPIDNDLAGMPSRLPKGDGIGVYGFGSNNIGVDNSKSAGNPMDFGSMGQNVIVKLLLLDSKSMRRKMRNNEVPSINGFYLDSDQYSMDTIYRAQWNTNWGNLGGTVRGSTSLDSMIKANEALINRESLQLNSFKLDTVNKHDVNVVHKKIKEFGGQN